MPAGPSQIFILPEDKAALVADLKSKYGALVEIPVPGGDRGEFVIAKRADRGVMRQRNSDKNHEVYRNQLDERLVVACVVWPDQHVLDSLLATYGFFAGEAAGEIMLFSGASTEHGTAKKL